MSDVTRILNAIERGEAQATIGWVGPIAYYARSVGAEIHRAYWLLKKPLN